MQAEYTILHRADRLIWTMIAIVALIICTSAWFGTFHIKWASYTKVTVACVVLAGAGLVYTHLRKDMKAAAALTGTAQIAAFAAVGAPLSYVAASADLPLWDVNLMAWDQHLDLDWTAWLAMMNDHPALHTIFSLAYMSFAVQVTTTVLVLAVTGHLLRLRTFITSFMLATFVTIILSALMPAQGVWGHLHLSDIDYPNIVPATRDLHLSVFHGLRDGTFRDLVAQGAEGIITFPSLHAALGLMFIWAIWPIKYLRWVIVVLNLVMIAATPVDGGHYFTDVIAGLIIAILCWHAASRLLGAPAPAATPDRCATIEAPSIAPSQFASPPQSAIAQAAETTSPDALKAT